MHRRHIRLYIGGYNYFEHSPGYPHILKIKIHNSKLHEHIIESCTSQRSLLAKCDKENQFKQQPNFKKSTKFIQENIYPIYV